VLLLLNSEIMTKVSKPIYAVPLMTFW